jgi:hypothetical protein
MANPVLEFVTSEILLSPLARRIAAGAALEIVRVVKILPQFLQKTKMPNWRSFWSREVLLCCCTV